MKLDGKEKKEFRETLIKAFYDKTSLEIMISDQLDQSLNTFVSGGTQEELVFSLIIWAEQQGCLGDLLIGALKQNSGNFELKRFFRKNINKLLVCDDPIIQLDLCYQLIPIIEKIKDFELIKYCAFSTLPDGFKDSNEQDIQDLENENLALVIKIFLVFKLLIILYPKQSSYPSILIFTNKLVSNIEDELVRQELINWRNKVTQEHGLSIPDSTRVFQSDDPLEAYLIITFAPTSELDKFCLNAYLELPKKTPIITIEADEQFQKGVIVSLKKTTHQKTPQAIINFIEKSEKCLKVKQKELGYKHHSLTIEFFLTLDYLHEEIENLKILKLKDWQPMGALYKIVVRSYDRLKDSGLWNELQLCWSKIEKILKENDNQQENHIGCLPESYDWKDLPLLLQNKIGLKLPCSLPKTEKIREKLFREIVQKGIPVAIWTRCSEIPGVDVVAELDKLLDLKSFKNPELMLDKIKQKRDEVKFQDKPEQFLGYLGILYESNRWEEIPLLEDIPLSE